MKRTLARGLRRWAHRLDPEYVSLRVTDRPWREGDPTQVTWTANRFTP